MNKKIARPVIIGAGPAGLTAGYYLAKHGKPPLILEADPQYVGGLSRTVSYKGNRFDIGGHRFFTKNQEIHNLWVELIGNTKFRKVQRLSRIFYKGTYFSYPLKPFEVLVKIGPVTSIKVLISYVKAKITPVQPEKSFEDWVSNRFGKRLFDMFFKSYTEKVWGRSTKDLSADWAAQRIQGLSLSSAVFGALIPKRGSGPKTLTETFHYPQLGPGQMWEIAAAKIESFGGEVMLGSQVVSLVRKNNRINQVEVLCKGKQSIIPIEGECFSSMPIRDLINCIIPKAPQEVIEAAKALEYRDFLTVALVIEAADIFPDNWLYIHDPDVRVGRIQNYRNWSVDMVSNSNVSTIGLEYFCQEDDDLWSMSDSDLLVLAKEEVARIGIAKGALINDGTVVRMPKAYPVYDDVYKKRIQVIRDWLEMYAQNLILIGRNGMHKYNNQDHSMLTGLLAAKNLCGDGKYDVWNVHTDATYDETLD